jgi:replicative DNA helicase
MTLTRRSVGDAPTSLQSRMAPEPTPRQNELVPPEEWSAESPEGLVQTRSLHTIAWRLNANSDSEFAERMRPIPTGFDALDQWIGGGLRAGELVLLGGSQGVGKTTLCLQMARNIASAGDANVLYSCYEHPDEYILNRLLVQESIDPSAVGRVEGLTLDELQTLLATVQSSQNGHGPFEAVRAHPCGGRALSALGGYAGRFHLVADAPRRNNFETLRALVAEHRKSDRQPLVLFVDYLQKVEPKQRDIPDEAERVTQVVQGLKEIALDYNIAVVAIVAAEKAGLQAARLRFTHLRGSSALMYEADVAIIMNEKWKIIDRDHIVFNPHKAEQYREWVICTIEKNRSGKNLVEVEFMKRFEYCCFNPRGGKVSERLYDERIQGERE